MKKLIKGLYIAFFPEQYYTQRERYINELQSRLIYTEDLLLTATGNSNFHLQGELNDKVEQIKAKREEARKLDRLIKSF